MVTAHHDTNLAIATDALHLLLSTEVIGVNAGRSPQAKGIEMIACLLMGEDIVDEGAESPQDVTTVPRLRPNIDADLR